MCRAAGAAGASDGHLPSNLKGRSNDRNFGARTNRDDFSITICLAAALLLRSVVARWWLFFLELDDYSAGESKR